MTNANQNPHTQSTANLAPLIALRVGPDDGTDPEAGDETNDYKLLTLTRFAGAQRIDVAELRVDLGTLGQQLIDLQTPTKWGKQVEVRLPDEEDPDVTRDLLFWGELTKQKLRIEGRSEGATVRATVERYHFGDPLTGYPVWQPAIGAATGQIATVERDPVFNPTIDGITEHNRSSRDERDDDDNQLYLFVDPESVRTSGAAEFQGESSADAVTAQEWTLAEAVAVICQICNPDEEFITNPNTEILDDAPAPQNLRLRRGLYLPSYLDELLHPVGFDWHLDAGLDGETRVSEIVIYEIGDGPTKQVRLQAPGETLDLAATNLQELQHDTSIAELANFIRASGSLKQYEVTLPLYRTWDESKDSLKPGSLTKTIAGEANQEYIDNPTVWRLFTANEAGDLTGVRSDSPSEPPDFAAEIGGTWVPRRRLMTARLELDADGRRIKPTLEWSDDAGDTWKPWDEGDVNQGPYKVLATQIGVEFTGQEPPWDLYRAGDDAQLRLTGTITGDERLERTRSKQDESPSVRDVELFLDVSDRFHFREVVTTGNLKSELYDAENDSADEVDDTQAVDDWIDKVGPAAEAATMTARIALHGLQFDYEIGDLIDKVDGRNISFNRNSEDAAEKKYLQVAGFQYDFQRQQTHLFVVAVEDR